MKRRNKPAAGIEGVAVRRVSRRVGGKKRPSLSGILAALCAVGLAIVVARAGAVYAPGAASHLRSVWDFTHDSSPSWISPNALVTRAPDGLVLTPKGEPAGVSSGPVDLDTGAHGRLRLRLKMGESSEGRVGFLVRTPSGSQPVERSFQARGGGAPEEIVVPVALDGAARALVREVMLVPSMVLQSVVISSITFESGEGAAWASLKELVSPLPGDSAARDPFAMHTLSPPLFDDRSVWAILVPIVFLAVPIAVALRENDRRIGVGIRRWAWGIVAAVWIFGFAIAFYHQAVALRVDLSRFGGLGRAEAYAVIDYVPLWEDMRQIARLIPPRASVEVVVAGDRPDVQATWKARAGYYLYPIVVRTPSAVRIHYFGTAHAPCTQVDPDRLLLHEAERYCIFRGME